MSTASTALSHVAISHNIDDYYFTMDDYEKEDGKIGEQGSECHKDALLTIFSILVNHIDNGEFMVYGGFMDYIVLKNANIEDLTTSDIDIYCTNVTWFSNEMVKYIKEYFLEEDFSVNIYERKLSKGVKITINEYPILDITQITREEMSKRSILCLWNDHKVYGPTYEQIIAERISYILSSNDNNASILFNDITVFREKGIKGIREYINKKINTHFNEIMKHGTRLTREESKGKRTFEGLKKHIYKKRFGLTDMDDIKNLLSFGQDLGNRYPILIGNEAAFLTCMQAKEAKILGIDMFKKLKYMLGVPFVEEEDTVLLNYWIEEKTWLLLPYSISDFYQDGKMTTAYDFSGLTAGEMQDLHKSCEKNKYKPQTNRFLGPMVTKTIKLGTDSKNREIHDDVNLVLGTSAGFHVYDYKGFKIPDIYSLYRFLVAKDLAKPSEITQILIAYIEYIMKMTPETHIMKNITTSEIVYGDYNPIFENMIDMTTDLNLADEEDEYDDDSD